MKKKKNKKKIMREIEESYKNFPWNDHSWVRIWRIGSLYLELINEHKMAVYIQMIKEMIITRIILESLEIKIDEEDFNCLISLMETVYLFLKKYHKKHKEKYNCTECLTYTFDTLGALEERLEEYSPESLKIKSPPIIIKDETPNHLDIDRSKYTVEINSMKESISRCPSNNLDEEATRKANYLSNEFKKIIKKNIKK